MHIKKTFKKAIPLTAAGLLLLLVIMPLTSRHPSLMDSRNANGGLEDPKGRLQYELMMTRDPQTGQIPPNIKARTLEFAKSIPGRLAKSGQFSASWTSVGPYNMGGRTRAVGIDVRNPDIIIAGGVSGAVFRSTDGGSSWNNVTPPQALHNITSLVQDTRAGHQDTWYYSTGEASGNSAAATGAWYYGQPVFKSTDNGASWTPLSSTVTNRRIDYFESFTDLTWKIVANAANSGQDEVLLATYGAVLRSVNGGSSWSVALGGSSPYAYYSDVAVTSQGVIYATLSNNQDNSGARPDAGLYRSTDGINYTEITPPAWPTIYNRTVVGITPSDENVVYFLCDAEGYGPGSTNTILWRYNYISGDGTGAGGLWTDLSANIPNYLGQVGPYNSQSSYNMHIHVHPSDPDIIYLGGTNLYRSTDGFTTIPDIDNAWIGGYPGNNQFGNYTNHHPDQHAIAFVPGQPQKMVSAHDGGLSMTTNNTASTVVWNNLNNGYLTTQFYTVALDHGTPGNKLLYGGLQDHGVFYTSNGVSNANWRENFSGDGAFVAIAPGAGFIYAASQKGKTYRMRINSDGSYNNWTRIDPAVDDEDDRLFITPSAMDPNNANRLYYASTGQIYRNNNCAVIPTSRTDPATEAHGWVRLPVIGEDSGDIITAISASTQPANIVYYGTESGKVYRIDNADSASPLQTALTSYLFPTGATVSCVGINPRDANQIVLTFSNYRVRSVFYSSDGGSSWSDISANLESTDHDPAIGPEGPSVRWAAWLAGSSDYRVFLGTSTGLYSTDLINGNSTIWVQEGPSTIGNVVVDMIKIRQSDGWVVAATHGKGVFASTFTTDVADEDNTQPRTLDLQPNYPNPFNPSTSIPFTVDKTRRVTLKLYDVSGRLVRTLKDDVLSPGQYTEKLDASQLPSGTYLVRLESEGAVKSHKITLIK